MESDCHGRMWVVEESEIEGAICKVEISCDLEEARLCGMDSERRALGEVLRGFLGALMARLW